MRVLLSTYGSRGDVEPLVGLAVRLRALGAQARVCAPPDFAERLAEVGVSLVPVGRPVRPLVTEKLGIRYVYASFQQLTLPSPHHPPLAYPGRPFPPEVTDNRVLWDLDAQNINELFGAALNTHRVTIGLPPLDNVRDYVITDQPWLATDPTLDPWQEPADLDVVQTGAWILTDVRPLPAELVAFSRVAAVMHHGGAGTTTATRAGTPQVVVPQVVVPQAVDQPYWAGRVADLGIGTAHDGPTPTTESLSAALRMALTPETRARATAVASTIRTDGRRWPRRCCSTRSAEKGRQCPREPSITQWRTRRT